MPFQWTYTFDLINCSGHRIMTAKSTLSIEEVDRVAEAYLRMFVDVVEVRVTERASVGYSLAWVATLGPQGLERQMEINYG